MQIYPRAKGFKSVGREIGLLGPITFVFIIGYSTM